jgi:hypothetical protein
MEVSESSDIYFYAVSNIMEQNGYSSTDELTCEDLCQGLIPFSISSVESCEHELNADLYETYLNQGTGVAERITVGTCSRQRFTTPQWAVYMRHGPCFTQGLKQLSA